MTLRLIDCVGPNRSGSGELAAGGQSQRAPAMREKRSHTAVESIDEALLLLDRVSRFLSVGGFKDEDPLLQIELAARCLAKARAELGPEELKDRLRDDHKAG